MHKNIFTYGTLMVPEVFLKVTGKQIRNLNARIEGFASYKIRGQSYPGIIKKRKASVEGILYLNVEPAEIKKLDQFEGDLYLKELVQVQTKDNKVIEAEVYLLKPEHQEALSNETWEKADFIQNHLNDFLQKDPGFKHLSRAKDVLLET